MGKKFHRAANDAKIQILFEYTIKSYNFLRPLSARYWLILSPDYNPGTHFERAWALGAFNYWWNKRTYIEGISG